MKNLISSVLLLLAMPICSLAQGSSEEEMESDRPTRAQGPAVVPPATLQIESGYEFQRDIILFEEAKEYLYPTTLFRIGLFKSIELRLNTDYKKEKRTAVRNGTGDLMTTEQEFTGVLVGTKITIFKGRGILPQIGIIS